MPDEIVINEAPEDEPEQQEGDTNIVVVTTPPAEPAGDYVTRAEFEAYLTEHSATGHGDLREQIGALAGIEALLVEDVEQAEEPPVVAAETQIEEPPAAVGQEGETQSERHAGLFV